jgi:hypothetical protein
VTRGWSSARGKSFSQLAPPGPRWRYGVADGYDAYALTDDDRRALERSANDVRQGRFATDEAVQKVFGLRQP